LLDIV
jgi:hypothetical protein